MGPLCIIFHQPGIHRSAHLRQITERIGIQNFPSKCTIEPLNVSVLSRLTWLNPMQDYFLIRTPVLQGLTNELRSDICRAPANEIEFKIHTARQAHTKML